MTEKQPAARTRRRPQRDTRERLMLAARESFGELGFASTRVDDIVKRAGTSHGTFYTYFEDKRDVLLALTEQAAGVIYGTAVAPLLRSAVRSPRDAVRARVAAFFRTYTDQADIVRTWNQASGMHREVDEVRGRIRDSIIGAVARLLGEDKERGLIFAEVDIEIAAVALVAMVEEFAARWFAERRPVGELEVDQLTDLWVRSVYREPSAPTTLAIATLEGPPAD